MIFLFLFSSALVFSDTDETSALYFDQPRNAAAGIPSSFPQSYPLVWNGNVVLDSLNVNATDATVYSLNPGQYRIKFSALKHFGNPLNDDDFEIYNSPEFYLVL